jgi:hypothetical protein
MNACGSAKTACWVTEQGFKSFFDDRVQSKVTENKVWTV